MLCINTKRPCFARKELYFAIGHEHATFANLNKG